VAWIDPETFNPGDLMRRFDRMPRVGDRDEWRHTQDYWAERKTLAASDLNGAEPAYDGVTLAASSVPSAAMA
jgi:hypothetical protein